MCLGVPGRVVEVVDVEHEIAVVEVEGVHRKVNYGLLVANGDSGVTPGEWVLVHLGFVMSKIDEEEAESSLAFLARLRDPSEEDLEALFEGRVGPTP